VLGPPPAPQDDGEWVADPEREDRDQEGGDAGAEVGAGAAVELE
jgi:hypothetical protein